MRFRRDQGSESETSLLQRTAAWQHHPTLARLTPEALAQLTRSEGVDFATALLFHQFQSAPEHAQFIQRINSLRLGPKTHPALKARVVIIPGPLYRERRDMGGDGRLVREVAESFGYQTDLIPLASFGSVAGNAGLICEWLGQHSSERLILVSLSKGGADLKLALSRPQG